MLLLEDIFMCADTYLRPAFSYSKIAFLIVNKLKRWLQAMPWLQPV